MSESAATAIVYLTADLMFSSRVSAASSAAGVDVALAANAAAAMSLLQDGRARLVLVDLTLDGLDVDDFMQQLASHEGEPPTVIAYGPHVHAERLAQARAAGCEVLSRGEFNAQMAQIVARAAN